MLKQSFNNKGFGLGALIVTVAAVVIVGGAGALVYHRNHTTKHATTTSETAKPKMSTHPSTPAEAVTAHELVAVAKQVYPQSEDTADNLPIVGSCGGKDIVSCPFTTSFAGKISATPVPTGAQGPGAILIAGVQNGPFGTLAYSATPNAQGGSVSVALTPDASAGGPAMNWLLTIKKTGTNLLVDDITYSRAASGSSAACGPVEIYNYTSCQ